jgi:L-iditol 2-dehydrogenase
MVIPEQMQVAVMHGIRDVRLETWKVPTPGPRDVLVKIERVGVCGSDVHYFTDGHIGRYVVEKPLVLGHESAGVIAAIGSEVSSLKVGDRVSLEPGYPCRTCYHCKHGRYNLCPDITFMATPPVDGAFAEYVAWPSDFVFKIPDGMSLDAAALLEPLAVGVWAVQRAGIGMGASVAVFGAGPIGCTTLQAAKAAGATTIIAIDLEPFRLDLAKQLGATHTINGRDPDVLEQVRAITSPLSGLKGSSAGVDAAFETAGSLITCRMTIEAARSGGVAILVGLPPDPLISLDLLAAASREVDIRGQFRYANCYPAALELVAQGRVNLDAMVTHRFGLDQAQQALEFADKEKKTSMKVMVEFA